MKKSFIIFTLICATMVACNSNPKSEKNSSLVETDKVEVSSEKIPELYNPNLDSLFSQAKTKEERTEVWLKVKDEGEKNWLDIKDRYEDMWLAIKDSAENKWLKIKEKALNQFKQEDPATYALYDRFINDFQKRDSCMEKALSPAYKKYNDTQMEAWRDSESTQMRAWRKSQDIQMEAWRNSQDIQMEAWRMIEVPIK